MLIATNKDIRFPYTDGSGPPRLLPGGGTMVTAMGNVKKAQERLLLDIF